MTERHDSQAADGLDLVGEELHVTLQEAHNALERFAEQRQDRELLHVCARRLHSAHGALRMIEVYGAALLAEEMVLVASALAEQQIGNEQEGLEALSRAIVQLPTYLDRVAGGGRDVPLVLLPLLNDLRAVRGKALLSESSLFILNANRSSKTPVRRGHDHNVNVRELARKLRAGYQAALLKWLRNQEPEASLGQLSDIAQQFEDAAGTTAVFQVWWVIGAVLEGIRDDGLRASASVKRLLGQGDRQIKELALHGEAAFEESPPTGLLNNLLYYVGRATSEGPKVTGVQSSFSLAELLEPADEAAGDQTLMNAPSANLMKTVGAAIRQDLGQVKDAIDIFVRTDSVDRGSLTVQRDALRKIADTLGVLGLDESRQQIGAESRRLQSFIDGHSEAGSALLQVAGTLISVEASLDHQLLAQIVPRAPSAEPASAADVARETDQRAGVEAVLRECIVNFTRIKEALTQYIAKPETAAALDQVPALLKGIIAGLVMLEKSRAVRAVERISWHIGQLRQRGREHLSAYELDRLADAIVSIEYFMDTVQKGRRDPEYMLDNAENCLQTLKYQPDAEAPPEAPMPRPESPAPAGATAPALPDIDAPVVADARVHVDPELLELFIEEAKEEIATLNRNVPRWRKEPENRELLLGIRRAYHTLKGSGRMVGATLIGEFAWSIEELLNAYINQSVTDTGAVADVLAHSLAALPELVEQLEVATPPRADVRGIAARATALASGQAAPSLPASYGAAADADADTSAAQAAAGVDESLLDEPLDDMIASLAGAVEQAEDEATASPSAAGITLDPVLHDIFRKETGDHLATINTFLQTAGASAVPPSVDDSLHRAWHTLCGSANMAAVQQVVDIAAPMNDYLRHALNAGCRLGPDAIEVMESATQAIEAIVASINTGSAPLPTHDIAETIAELEFEPTPADDDEAVGYTALPVELQDESGIDLTGSQPALADADRGEGGFDPEIAAIFADEAAELLEQSDAALVAWLDDASQQERLAELLRHLHTLKGGARMAGVLAMGNLSHELETLFERLSSGEQALDDVCRDLLRRGFDRLHSMQESLADQQAPPHGRNIIADIQRVYASPDADATPAVDADAQQAIGTGAADVAASAEAASVAQALEAEAQDAAAREAEAREAAAQEAELREAEAREVDAREAAAREAAAREAEAREAAAREAEAQEAEAQEAAASAESADEAVSSIDFASDDRIVDISAIADSRDVADAGDLVASVADADQVAARFADSATPADEVADLAAAAEAESAEAAPAEEIPQGETAAAARAEERADAETAEAAETAADVSGDAAAREPAPAAPDSDEHLDELEQLVARASTLPEASDIGRAARDESPRIAPPGGGAERRPDYARIEARLLDDMLNNAGEVSIFHARLEQEVGSIAFNLTELAQTVSRLRSQLRKLDAETEAQIRYRHQEEVEEGTAFDPLEMDRYSTIQQLSRALGESVSDLVSIQDLLNELTGESENLLVQQARVTTELQDALIRTRMLPFSTFIPRLERVVRGAARDAGKRVDLSFTGGSGELDRQVLQRMMPPFEHMLRNAVVHGIESDDHRRLIHKSPAGRIDVALQREGAEMVIRVQDDGAGLDVDTIKSVARNRGLIDVDSTLVGNDALNLILTPGFSTASEVTHVAGRGVGMDVVANEVKLLGGSLAVESTPGQGTLFTVRLPLTLAVTQALLVRCADERFAIPLPAVEGIVRIPTTELQAQLADPDARYRYGDQSYRFEHLGRFIGAPAARLDEAETPTVALVLVRAGEHSTALITDEVIGSREVVVKSAGPLVAGIDGIAGATILGDGSIVIILDVAALVRRAGSAAPAPPQPETSETRPLIMVVDDSITVRRVTQRLLERNDMRVVTAKDGVDAVALLEEEAPDLMLLDIEMPRMDGYEVATHIRNSPHLQALPIVMVTSRTGEKHRARAFELGVDGYLGKPYQETQLLDEIRPLLRRHERRHGSTA